MAAPTGRTSIQGWPYPTPDDDVNVPRDIQALADAMDGKVLYLTSGAYALRPPVANVPDNARYFATDKRMTFQKISGAWVLIEADPVVSASRPTLPVDGQLWEFDAAGIVGAGGNTLKGGGVRWIFRYDGTGNGGTNTNYWVRIDGGEFFESYVATAQAQSVTSPAPWGDAATIGPSIVVPSWTGISDWEMQMVTQFFPGAGGITQGVGLCFGAGVTQAGFYARIQVASVTGGIIHTLTHFGRLDAVPAGQELRMRSNNGNNANPTVSERRLQGRPIRIAA